MASSDILEILASALSTNEFGRRMMNSRHNYAKSDKGHECEQLKDKVIDEAAAGQRPGTGR